MELPYQWLLRDLPASECEQLPVLEPFNPRNPDEKYNERMDALREQVTDYLDAALSDDQNFDQLYTAWKSQSDKDRLLPRIRQCWEMRAPSDVGCFSELWSEDFLYLDVLAVPDGKGSPTCYGPEVVAAIDAFKDDPDPGSAWERIHKIKEQHALSDLLNAPSEVKNSFYKEYETRLDRYYQLRQGMEELLMQADSLMQNGEQPDYPNAAGIPFLQYSYDTFVYLQGISRKVEATLLELQFHAEDVKDILMGGEQ